MDPDAQRGEQPASRKPEGIVHSGVGREMLGRPLSSVPDARVARVRPLPGPSVGQESALVCGRRGASGSFDPDAQRTQRRCPTESVAIGGGDGSPILRPRRSLPVERLLEAPHRHEGVLGKRLVGEDGGWIPPTMPAGTKNGFRGIIKVGDVGIQRFVGSAIKVGLDANLRYSSCISLWSSSDLGSGKCSNDDDPLPAAVALGPYHGPGRPIAEGRRRVPDSVPSVSLDCIV